MLLIMSVYTKWLLKEEDKKIKDKLEEDKQIELINMAALKIVK